MLFSPLPCPDGGAISSELLLPDALIPSSLDATYISPLLIVILSLSIPSYDLDTLIFPPFISNVLSECIPSSPDCISNAPPSIIRLSFVWRESSHEFIFNIPPSIIIPVLAFIPLELALSSNDSDDVFEISWFLPMFSPGPWFLWELLLSLPPPEFIFISPFLT